MPWTDDPPLRPVAVDGPEPVYERAAAEARKFAHPPMIESEIARGLETWLRDGAASGDVAESWGPPFRRVELDAPEPVYAQAHALAQSAARKPRQGSKRERRAIQDQVRGQWLTAWVAAGCDFHEDEGPERPGSWTAADARRQRRTRIQKGCAPKVRATFGARSGSAIPMRKTNRAHSVTPPTGRAGPDRRAGAALPLRRRPDAGGR